MNPGAPLIPADRKLEGIHGLRGLAALSIVLFHFVYIAKIPAPHWLTFTTTHFNLGVLLFFGLSALSLYHSSTFTPASYGAYLIKRFFRIAPLFYLMVCCMLWWGGIPDWKVLLINLTFIFNLFPGQHESLVWAGWSVGVEMLFYLFLPAILHLAHRPIPLLFLLLGAVAMSELVWRILSVPGSAEEQYAYFSLLTNLAPFAAGLLAYRYAQSQALQAWRRWGWEHFILAAACAGLVLAGYYDAFGLKRNWTGVYFSIWAVLLGLVCLWQCRFPSAVLRAWPLQWLGDRSYSIYLLHPVIMILLTPVYKNLLAREWLSAGWRYPVGLAITLLILLTAANITYRLVELPGIALGRRISANLKRPIPNLDNIAKIEA